MVFSFLGIVIIYIKVIVIFFIVFQGESKRLFLDTKIPADFNKSGRESANQIIVQQGRTGQPDLPTQYQDIQTKSNPPSFTMLQFLFPLKLLLKQAEYDATRINSQMLLHVL